MEFIARMRVSELDPLAHTAAVKQWKEMLYCYFTTT